MCPRWTNFVRSARYNCVPVLASSAQKGPSPDVYTMSPMRIGVMTSGVRKVAPDDTRHCSALLSELISPFAPTGSKPTVGPSLHDGTTIRSGVQSGFETNRHAPLVFGFSPDTRHTSPPSVSL